MLISNLFFTLLPIAIHASIIPVKRQFSVVLADAQLIDLDIRNTTDKVNACTCTTSQAQAYVNALVKWERDLGNATDDCNSVKTSRFTVTQGQQFITYLNNTFLPDLNSNANAHIQHATIFKAAGFTPFIRAYFCRLRAKTSKWCDCLVTKTSASPAQKSAQQSTCTKILTQLDRVHDAYGNATCP